jgi:drug/metabolite transporter (DMT)-like permease
VNPVVAVVVGHFVGGELVGPRTLLGTLFVLVSVITITTMPKAGLAAGAKEEGALAELSPAKAE